MGDPNARIPNTDKIELLNDRAAITELIDNILLLAADAGLKDAAIFAVRLAIEEAITKGKIQITVEDQGPGFVPEKLPDPTLMENLSKPFGRGVMLMKAYMTEVLYNTQGNRVTMRYHAS